MGNWSGLIYLYEKVCIFQLHNNIPSLYTYECVRLFHNEFLNYTSLSASNSKMTANDELKFMQKEVGYLVCFLVLFDHMLDEVQKVMKNLVQDRLFLGQGLGPPKYEAGALTT
jgi:hypothetical protein